MALISTGFAAARSDFGRFLTGPGGTHWRMGLRPI
jgi:hypothetical protein